MAVNDPQVQPIVRAPRLRILNSGTPMPGAVNFRVLNNNYYSADTFSATFLVVPQDIHDLKWWGDQTEILLDIQASIDAGQSWQSLILGQVDRITVDPVAGVIETTGRDLTARLIDAKTRESFLNQTSSQIAQTLAGRHGLTADVTATGTPLGRFYGADHDRLTQGQFSYTTTEWDLLCNAAQHEGYDVWVTGTTLHFHPSQSLDSTPPYDVVVDPSTPSGNFIKLTMERSLTLAKDIVVSVRSWNSKQAKGFTVFSPSFLSTKGRVAKGTAQEFSFVRPNLNGVEAQALANKIHEDLTKSERLLTIDMPADLVLTARMPVRLRGTNSSWDQKYYTDAVTRSMGFNAGFQMTVKCKNHSPQTSVLGA